MTKQFKSDTEISGPVDTKFTSVKDMNGFGFDPHQGIFVIQDDGTNYMDEPLPFELGIIGR